MYPHLPNLVDIGQTQKNTLYDAHYSFL